MGRDESESENEDLLRTSKGINEKKIEDSPPKKRKIQETKIKFPNLKSRKLYAAEIS